MFDLDFSTASLDSIAHIIQLALTPVFLLTGLAGLMNVFSTRLGRVADRVDLLTEALEAAGEDEVKRLRGHLEYLRIRSWVLDGAVVLGAIGGAATCAATLTLFVGALRNATIAGILFTLFATAILSTLGALTAFLVEVLMAGQSLRDQARADLPIARLKMKLGGAEARVHELPANDPTKKLRRWASHPKRRRFFRDLSAGRRKTPTISTCGE